MCFLNRILIIALLLLEIAAWMPGIEKISYFSLRLFAVVLALLNSSIRPLMLLCSIKINIYNTALITFILNVFIFYIASTYYLGIHIATLSGGLAAFLIIWVSSTILNRYVYIETTKL